MRHYRRNILAMLVAVTLPAFAQGYWLVVWLDSGGRISYPLTERPKVTHSGAVLTVSTTGTTVEYTKPEVHKFTLSDTDLGGVESSVADSAGELSRFGDTVELSGFAAGTSVSIYSVSGQRVISGRTLEDGTLTLDLSHLGSGIYLVTTGSITHKIIKR